MQLFAWSWYHSNYHENRKEPQKSAQTSKTLAAVAYTNNIGGIFFLKCFFLKHIKALLDLLQKLRWFELCYKDPIVLFEPENTFPIILNLWFMLMSEKKQLK